MRRWFKDQQGSMVLEAALTLPFFLAFVMLLVGLVNISLAEMALQSTVSEAAKVMAANMYPMQQIYKKGQAQWQNSQAGTWISAAVTQVENARNHVTDAEAFVDDYAAWIPEPLVQLVAWEKNHREQAESWGTDKLGEARQAAERKIAETATPMIAAFADEGRLDKEWLKVTKLHFPNMDVPEEAYVMIEAEYTYTFRVPFFQKTVLLRKKATERAWIGGGS